MILLPDFKFSPYLCYMNTLFSLSKYAQEELKDTYDIPEIKSIFSLILTNIFHYTNIDIHLKKHESLDESFVNKFYDIIHLLKSGKPIQYIIGETEFCGLRIGLNPATLIPRPETEELVYWIKESAQPDISILDIGTGSGCIAISLACLLPTSRTEAVDIQQKALRQAKANAQHHQVSIRFYERDILNYNQYEWPTYDLIVSNPPYVCEHEKAQMQSRVLDYEPHSALFVPDKNPLLFYRQIAAFGLHHLNSGGMLYFEINEAFGEEMKQLMDTAGYRHIVLKKDFYGKDRFIRGEKV